VSSTSCSQEQIATTKKKRPLQLSSRKSPQGSCRWRGTFFERRMVPTDSIRVSDNETIVNTVAAQAIVPLYLLDKAQSAALRVGSLHQTTRPQSAPDRAKRLTRYLPTHANVAELADAQDLGSCPVRGAGSTPAVRTRRGLSSDMTVWWSVAASAPSCLTGTQGYNLSVLSVLSVFSALGRLRPL
jgi:hypothetical protein